MNWLPLFAIYMLGRMQKPHGPKWPTPKHPPPRSPRHVQHVQVPSPPQPPEPPRPPSPPEPPHVARAPAPLHNAAPASVTQVHHADLPPTVRSAPAAPRPAATSLAQPTAISDAQKILKSLGFRDREGKLSDGLFGPLTRDDWALAAHNRGLDGTFERLGPTTAHVNPATLARLRRDAISRGMVSGKIYIP